MGPQSRAEAIAKIRALAEAGGMHMHPRAHDRMEQLGYNEADVEDCVCGLSENDCFRDGSPEHPELAPQGAWVYEFVTTFSRDRLYVKICLNPRTAYVLSFKLDGSPA